jgi:hypothetical protein
MCQKVIVRLPQAAVARENMLSSWDSKGLMPTPRPLEEIVHARPIFPTDIAAKIVTSLSCVCPQYNLLQGFYYNQTYL